MKKKQSNIPPGPSTVGGKTVKAIEPPQKAVNNRQAVKPQNPKEPRPGIAKTSQPKLIIKNGATDCRRSEKALSEVVDQRMHMNSHSGDMYGFANSTQTIAKVIQHDETGAILYKKHSDTPFKWPQYDSGVSVLEGSQAKEFLADIGLPKEILKSKSAKP
jgi:hypothetical protein